jgi:hypothetical protein
VTNNQFIPNYVLNEREAAALLKVSVSMMRKMRRKGTGPAFCSISTSIRYPANELAAFIQERTATTIQRAA